MYENGVGKGYKILSNYLQERNIDNFKQHPDINYAIEHDNEAMTKYAVLWFDLILKNHNIEFKEIIRLIELNDSTGNPKKVFINKQLPLCNPNSIKYIYIGLLNIKYILNNHIEINNFIEIGGGYGGQCLILLELFRLYNIKINKYILIDLPEVVKFQKKYLLRHKKEENCIFLSFNDFYNYNFEKENYFFSCYCFGEISNDIRKIYYDNLFSCIHKGFIVWNINPIDLPRKYFSFEEYPQTGNNKFIYF